MTSTRIPLIIDTDPGLEVPWADVDDNLAVILALAQPELDVRLISVVAGNTPALEGAASIGETIAMAGRSVPIALGAQRPLIKPFVSGRQLLAERMQGQTADSWSARARDTPPVPVHLPQAFAAQAELLEASREKLAFVCLGPLTNLARLVQGRPDLVERIDSVVIMGGALNRPGNVTSLAEFNIWIDPDAAALVFAAPIRKVLVSLDITMTVRITQAEVEASLSGGGDLAEYLIEGVRLWSRLWKNATGEAAFVPHDPIALSYLIDPAMFETEPMTVRVESDSGQTQGVRGEDGDTLVCTRLDQARFKRLFFSALSRIASP